MRFCYFLFLVGCLTAQEDVAKTNFPIRLTPEEQAAQQQQAPQEDGSCCPAPVERNVCPPPCCKPPSLNCPPLQPRCNPCDCILDYYNPLIFNGFDVSIEWLYWTVHQKASTFVLTPQNHHQPFPPVALNDALGKYKYSRFDWSSGIRAGFGYTIERDAWHLLGQYTYFHPSGSNEATRPTDLTLYLEATNKNINSTAEGLDLIQSSLRLSYQAADVLLSRRFLPGCQILFNFFTGATGAWIREKWSIAAFDTTNVTTFIKNTWRFGGGGIRAGFDTSWHMGMGFGIFNKVSVATLVGPFFNKKAVTLDPQTLPGDIFNIPLGFTTEHEIWVVPNTQIEFGLSWNHRFCRWAMSLLAAFEINTWYDLHQYHQSMQATSAANNNHLDYRNASDVSLWGINLRTEFTF